MKKLDVIIVLLILIFIGLSVVAYKLQTIIDNQENYEANFRAYLQTI